MNVVGKQNELYVGLLDETEVKFYWGNIEEVLSQMPELLEVTTVDRIHEEVEAGQLQVWAVGDKAAMHLVLMTQIVDLPNQTKELQIKLCFGVMLNRYWRLIVETFEDVALKLQCRTLSVDTRRLGFVKLLQAEGYEVRNYEVARVLGTPAGTLAN